MTTRARCPAGDCGSLIDLPAERLGRSMHCPSCGVRMTARPLGIEEQLRRQQMRLSGGRGMAIERLPLIVLVDNVRSLWNVGSIFRSADSCGVRRLYLTGITGCPPRAQIAKTALGAEQAVAWRYYAEPLDALDVARRAGFESVAIETSPGAAPIDAVDWPDRVCLVIGNEVAGVSSPVIASCRHHVRIPMRGVKESLNVAVAFGIAAYEAARSLAGRRGETAP